VSPVGYEKTRTVEISKTGKRFFPTSYFDNTFRYIEQSIAALKKIMERNKKRFAEKLGSYDSETHKKAKSPLYMVEKFVFLALSY
jgi:fido (protein-threonine AMPylation protein)